MWFRRKATVVFSLLIKEKISVFINIAVTQHCGPKILTIFSLNEICLIIARAKTLSNQKKGLGKNSLGKDLCAISVYVCVRQIGTINRHRIKVPIQGL